MATSRAGRQKTCRSGSTPFLSSRCASDSGRHLYHCLSFQVQSDRSGQLPPFVVQPSNFGTSMMALPAVNPAFEASAAGLEVKFSAFETITTITSVSQDPDDQDMAVISGVGMPADATFTVKLGEKPCPVVTHSDGRIVCNRRLGEEQHFAATTFYSSCLQLLLAKPSTESGAHKLQPDGAGTPLVEAFCDMDTAGGGWTLCGKFDRDNSAGHTSLASGFGRSDVGDPADMTALGGEFSGGGGSQASSDCRQWLGADATAYVLSMGSDTSETNPTSSVISGPLASTARDSSLFDTAVPSVSSCTASAVHSYDSKFHSLDPDITGLNFEYWYYDENKTGSIEDLGCNHVYSCFGQVVDSGVQPDGTGSLGIQYFPNYWRKYTSYAVRLTGYFVPPNTAEYKFVVWGDRGDRAQVFISSDHDAANKNYQRANHRGQGRNLNLYSTSDYTVFNAGEAYYFEIQVLPGVAASLLRPVSPRSCSAPASIPASCLSIALGWFARVQR